MEKAKIRVNPEEEQIKKKGRAIIIIPAVLCVGLLIFVLVAAFLPGASSPEGAVVKYEKACMYYDASDMVKYSSDYNRYLLNHNKHPESAGELKSALKQAYKGVTSRYAGKKTEVKFSKIESIGQDSPNFNALKTELQHICPKVNPTEFADMTFTVYTDGFKAVSRQAYAVKYGGRWYYFK